MSPTGTLPDLANPLPEIEDSGVSEGGETNTEGSGGSIGDTQNMYSNCLPLGVTDKIIRREKYQQEILFEAYRSNLSLQPQVNEIEEKLTKNIKQLQSATRNPLVPKSRLTTLEL